jgi:hypothetical protein
MTQANGAGGLWITNDDGSEARRIVNSNVHAVVPIDGGILVLSGLAHLSLDSGKAFIFSNPTGVNIFLLHSANLDGEPAGMRRNRMAPWYSLPRTE